MKSIEYRPDIDGLRAFAVLAVLGFHAFPRWVPGGFIGVDIFFVISGFLISTIILTSLNQNTFSLKKFYAKRIRRIFPALLLVLTSCFVAGWLGLVRSENYDLGKHILGGIGFVSNFILMDEAGYFDKQSNLKPLLHLWSLGIEEQFYIFWPIFLYVIWRVRLNLPITLILLISLSLGLNIFNLRHMQSTVAFYHPFNRAWELGIGGLLAVLILFYRPNLRSALNRLSAITKLNSGTIRGILAVLGLLILAYALLFFNSQQSYPGRRALFPTIGTFLTIAAGNEAWLNKKLLSQRLLVAIGLISFPLYLWHWPLLLFPHLLFREIEPPPILRAILLAFSFLLAWLTYRFVEKPIRLGKRPMLNNTFLCTGMISLGCLVLIGRDNSMAPQSAYSHLERFEQASAEWEFPTPGTAAPKSMQALKPFQFQGSTFYIDSNALNKNKVLYIGDSQMQVAAARIVHLISEQPKRYKSAIFAVGGNCSPIPNVRAKIAPNPDCVGLPDKALAYAKNNEEVGTVVIGSLWSACFRWYACYYENADGTQTHWSAGAEKAYAELEKMLLTLREQKKRVYILLQLPNGYSLDPAKMVVRDFNITKLRFEDKIVGSGGTTRSDMNKLYGEMNKRLKQIANRTGAKVIDPMDTVCGIEDCPALTKDGEPMYKDGWHLRSSYMRNNGTFMDETLEAN